MYTDRDLFKGFFWSGIDKLGSVILQILLEVILARLLLPKDYGVIGIVLVFISLSVTISEGGFSNALIFKQNRNETDYATVFYFNISMAVFIYVVIYFTAPLVETFFEINDLSIILRIFSVSIILNSFILVHRAKLNISMDFKLQAKLSLLSLILSGIIGVYLAYKNYGVWALVYQNLSMSFFNAVLLWIIYKWTPHSKFSFPALKKLFSFGSNVLVSSLIQCIYFNTYPFLIGKYLGMRNLGLYSKSSQFTQVPSNVLTTVVQRVLMPYFSSCQNDNNKIFELNQIYTKISCLLFFPFFFILATLSYPLVIILLSSTWESMTPIFLILSLAYIFYPITVNNMIMFQVKNKTSLFLKIEVFTILMGIIILLFTFRYGMIAIAYGIFCHQFFQFIFTSFFVQRILGKGIFDQIKIVLPFLVFGLILMYSVQSVLGYVRSFFYIKLAVGLAASVFGYISFYLLCYKNDIISILKIIKKSK